VRWSNLCDIIRVPPVISERLPRVRELREVQPDLVHASVGTAHGRGDGPVLALRSPDAEAVALKDSPVVQGKVPRNTTSTVQVVTRIRQRRRFTPTIGCEPHTRSAPSERQQFFMDTPAPGLALTLLLGLQAL
jgi:hypothetical protein